MASRRVYNATDESTQSGASSVMRHAQLAFQYLEATELEHLPGDAILKRSLNINSVISTSSSFATRCQRAVSHADLQHIIQIGEGFQGTIFEQVGLSWVMKKEKPGNDTIPSNLRHEYSMHSDVTTAFDRYAESVGCNVHVPRLFGIIPTSDSAFWQEHLHKFPDGYRNRTTIVRMERILPLPKVIRRALVSQFYPRPTATLLDAETTNRVLSDPPNKHCIARTYLGRDGGIFTKEKFSLRNFPLYLKAMERLNLDTESLAASMGKAYALMHWAACVNGDDVEFALGTSAVQNEEHSLDFQHRAIGLYLLDFGQCDAVDLSEDAAVVYQAFKGAMVMGDNQWFIPHYKKSPELFAVFEKAYIEAGQTVINDKALGNKFNIQEFMAEYVEYAEDFLV
ncbi:Uncharacterized protein TPAR_08444 [Tolypocladium paradoxum]|uniref:DUF3669 domain-containing protein n=1 Tax=Tolypocladium paradoxum TaxID=94208 RepID=A0A2S4KMI8_9HYPO|nr:Uncharacterized protein TPAR_08444 [Tolypocladium paradoxum]